MSQPLLQSQYKLIILALDAKINAINNYNKANANFKETKLRIAKQYTIESDSNEYQQAHIIFKNSEIIMNNSINNYNNYINQLISYINIDIYKIYDNIKNKIIKLNEIKDKATEIIKSNDEIKDDIINYATTVLDRVRTALYFVNNTNIYAVKTSKSIDKIKDSINDNNILEIIKECIDNALITLAFNENSNETLLFFKESNDIILK
jgi:hypothetical protein